MKVSRRGRTITFRFDGSLGDQQQARALMNGLAGRPLDEPIGQIGMTPEEKALAQLDAAVAGAPPPDEEQGQAEEPEARAPRRELDDAGAAGAARTPAGAPGGEEGNQP
jgi:hypothetical protein